MAWILLTPRCVCQFLASSSLPQTRKLMDILRLSSEEPPPILNQKRKQAEVFMVNNITEMLLAAEPSQQLDDSDEDSDDSSQKSSQSYRAGVGIYKTSLFSSLSVLDESQGSSSMRRSKGGEKSCRNSERPGRRCSPSPVGSHPNSLIKHWLWRWSASNQRRKVEWSLTKLS
jgi:hypothetical protein